jgi:adenosylmethionine---8-amino-7-oxononanoate aminotransferase
MSNTAGPFNPEIPAREASHWLALDRAHVLHPYTSPIAPLPVYPVERASGVTIELADGTRLIDGMSSWWAAIHGYAHPRLDAAAKHQLSQVSHVMFGGFTHKPAVQLAQRLIALAPNDAVRTLDKVFFCDSGSVCVEVAIKLALQYWQARSQASKHRVLALRGGYHGDTFMAMSVCDPVQGMHSMFASVLTQQLFAPRPQTRFGMPWDPQDISGFETLLSEHSHELAAVILEPIVQGAGGMWFYHPEYLRRVRALCDAHDVLLICDEIATGFGRTGKLFACEHAGIAPDILCLGKALTGGYLTLAACLTTTRITDAIGQGPAGGAFMHGPTFMANPLACAIANESVAMASEPSTLTRVHQLEVALRAGLEPCRALPSVADVRVLGAIGVVEMHKPVDVAEAQRFFVGRGVWIRPFGRLIYLMPPFIADLDAIRALTSATRDWATCN